MVCISQIVVRGSLTYIRIILKYLSCRLWHTSQYTMNLNLLVRNRKLQDWSDSVDNRQYQFRGKDHENWHWIGNKSSLPCLSYIPDVIVFILSICSLILYQKSIFFYCLFIKNSSTFKTELKLIPYSWALQLSPLFLLMVKGQGNTSQSALRTQSWGIHFLQEILLKVQMSLNMPWNLNVSTVKVKAYLCSKFFLCKGRISMQFFYSYYSFRRVGCN